MSRGRFLVGILIVIVLVGVISFIVTRKHNQNGSGREAVVLTTGQTYFGYIVDENDQYLTLRDVYYPQDPTSIFNTNRDVEKHVSLFHFGDEVYAPESVMHINRDQVIYHATMRADSKINKAIDDSLAAGSSSDSTSSPTTK